MFLNYHPLGLKAVCGFESPGPGTNGMLEIGVLGGVPTYRFDSKSLLWRQI